jgi:histidinol-phosphate aminotransferase
MTNRFINQAAPGLASLKPYVPGKPLAELERELGVSGSIKLASNENPLGPSPRVRAALEAQISDLSRYPDGGAYELRRALAAHHDVDAACVTVGNGSNDVLDMVARVFLCSGRESLFSQYAFAVYPISSMAVGATLRIVPSVDYGHDLVAMRAMVTERTGVVWIANPNNPTGTHLGRSALRQFIESLPPQLIVVIDEAYFEYANDHDFPDASQWLADFPNLIVTRTFSKAYGLAALRVGYGLSHPDIADLLNRVRQPFNVDSFAQAAALAALEDQDYVRRSVEVNEQGMRQLMAGIERLGLGYIPSVGNFLTIDLGRDAGPVDQALLRLGVVTRPVANYGLPNHLRVSIGLADENSRFLTALEQVL